MDNIKCLQFRYKPRERERVEWSGDREKERSWTGMFVTVPYLFPQYFVGCTLKKKNYGFSASFKYLEEKSQRKNKIMKDDIK